MTSQSTNSERARFKTGRTNRGVDIGSLVGQLVSVLDEGFDAPQKPWSYFVDNQPGAGLLGMLWDVTATRAAEKVGQRSIAEHVAHITFGMNASTAWINGDRTFRDWSESWNVPESLDETTWRKMTESLRGGYVQLREAMERNALSSVESLGGAMGAIAHVAYHFGIIRQKRVMQGAA